MSQSKLFFVFFFIMIFSTNLFCQSPLKRNVYTLGGAVDISFENNKYELYSNKAFRISASPSLGYFVTDNILILGRVGFSYYESDYDDSFYMGKFYSREYSIGTSLRYYFNSEKIIPFLGTGVDYDYIRYTHDRKDYNIAIIFTGGLNYFLSKEIAFEPFISYSVILRDGTKKYSNNLRIGAGINYYFIH